MAQLYTSSFWKLSLLKVSAARGGCCGFRAYQRRARGLRCMTSEHPAGKPRIAEPVRNQGVLRFEIPEDALPPTHPARVLWDVSLLG